jgi:hypothetical protein
MRTQAELTKKQTAAMKAFKQVGEIRSGNDIREAIKREKFSYTSMHPYTIPQLIEKAFIERSERGKYRCLRLGG